VRRCLATGGTFTRRDDRLLAPQDEMVRILGDLGPAWGDARAALNRLHAVLQR